MMEDPRARLRRTNPYEVLAEVGITPASTQREVRDASFELMAGGGMTPEQRAAWDELRRVESRLVVDFLFYDVDLAAAVAGEKAALEAELERWEEPSSLLDLAAGELFDLAEMESDVGELEIPQAEVAFLAELAEPVAADRLEEEP